MLFAMLEQKGAGSVRLLLSQAGFSAISHVQDLAGINRVTLGQLA